MWHLHRRNNQHKRDTRKLRRSQRGEDILSPYVNTDSNIRLHRVPQPENPLKIPPTAMPRIRRGRYAALLVPPADFSFRRNFDEVANFFQHLRQIIYERRNNRIGIDFRALRQISPGAALVLAAELHRWQLTIGKKLRTLFRDDWDPIMSQIFEDFGLFEFLETPNHQKVATLADNHLKVHSISKRYRCHPRRMRGSLDSSVRNRGQN